MVVGEVQSNSGTGVAKIKPFSFASELCLPIKLFTSFFRSKALWHLGYAAIIMS